MGYYHRPRRYYLRKAQQAQREESPLHEAWLAKQRAMPGIPLPADFPYLSALQASGYEAVEDLHGADDRELLRCAGLNHLESERVLTALAPLVALL